MKTRDLNKLISISFRFSRIYWRVYRVIKQANSKPLSNMCHSIRIHRY